MDFLISRNAVQRISRQIATASADQFMRSVNQPTRARAPNPQGRQAEANITRSHRTAKSVGLSNLSRSDV